MNRILMNLVMSFLLLSSGSFLLYSEYESDVFYGFESTLNDIFDQDYSTLFGNGNTIIYDSDIDDQGNIYVVGITKSSQFPTTEGCYCDEHHGGGYYDLFVAKIDNRCEEIIFSTLLGGSGEDQGRGICVDDEGYVYVTGYTSSDDFPTTTGAFNRSNSGNNDIFITKFTPDGTDLVYSTYIGGVGYDWVEKIALDDEGAAYIVGYSWYFGYPSTVPSFPKNDGPGFLVVTKIDPTGSFLEYSLTLGTRGTIVGNDIAVDKGGQAYVTGAVKGEIYVTNDVFDDTYNGYFDVFVLKLDPNGVPIFSTYVGGSFDDEGYGIAVDSNEDIYVTGVTGQLTMGSYDFPVTTGAFKTYMNGSGDAFVFKMNKSGGSLEYSTYLGGDFGEYGISIDLDDSNNAYVTGRVGSDDYHSTYGAFSRTIFGGIWDVFLTVMNDDGSDLLYSTFLGGSEEDRGTAVHYIGNNSVLIGGYTDSDDFPVSQRAVQKEAGYLDDGFVTVLNLTTVPHPPRNLTFESIDAHSLVLSWDAPAYDGGSLITGYNIYRASIPGKYEKINSTSSENLSISVLDHDPSKAWRYHVRSENALGESLPSNILILDDLIRPDFIEDHTPSVGYTGDPLEFEIEVRDNFGLREVDLEIIQNGYVIFNGSMERGPGNAWKYSFMVPHSIEPLEYRFIASDFRNNINISQSDSVTILDNDPPMIDVIDPPELATTGDPMTIECILFDHINLESAYLEIRGEGHSDDPIPLTGPESNKWTCSYMIPSDNVNELEYSINATDGINFNSTPWRSVQVSDNDPPTFIADRSDPAAFNGRDYHFEIEITDNIGVTDTWCSVKFDDITGMNITLDHLEYDFYSGQVMIPENVRSFSYIPGAMDREMNVLIGITVIHDVIDDIKPILVDDLTPETAFTGDPFEFSVSVDDNMGIERVSIEYGFGEDYRDTIILNFTGLYSAGVMIPDDSLDELVYILIIDDSSGNRLTTSERIVNVIDNDPPEISIIDPPESIGTGEELMIELNVRDNIKVRSLSVISTINGEEWLNDDLTSIEEMDHWITNIPDYIVGTLSISFTITDSSGNQNESGPDEIMIVDVISPDVVPVNNITVVEGEYFQVFIIAEDNIGIESITWEGLPSSHTGKIWGGELDDTGEYPVTVTVIDEAGNEKSISFTVTVQEKDEENRPVGIIIVLVVLSILIILGVVAFLMIRKRKDGPDGFEENPDL